MDYPQLTLFISYHPEESAVLSELLDWLEPFRHKYFLDIYYHRYASDDEVNKQEYTEKLHNAHVYLYLMSTKWINNLGLQKREVDGILERRHTLGKERILMYPIPVKPCQWRSFSKIIEVEDAVLPNAKQVLTQVDARDEAYKLIVERLEKDIAPLRLNLIEETKLKGLSTLGFFNVAMTPREKAPKPGSVRFSLDDLKQWSIVALLLFLIYCVYIIGCQRRPFE